MIQLCAANERVERTLAVLGLTHDRLDDTHSDRLQDTPTHYEDAAQPRHGYGHKAMSETHLAGHSAPNAGSTRDADWTRNAHTNAGQREHAGRRSSKDWKAKVLALRMSRTAKRPSGGYRANDSTHSGLVGMIST